MIRASDSKSLTDATQASGGPSVLIVGAGVAGTVCGIRLRQLGFPVTIAEKENFPRNKVCGCCIGGAGLQAFERISLRDWLVSQGETTRVWKSSIGHRLIELSLPDGIAISRQTLDSGLLQQASDAGATVLQPCRVVLEGQTEEYAEVTLHTGDETRQQRFDLVVMAGGLNAAGLNQALPWRVAPHGPFGAAFHAEIDEIEAGAIYMGCDDDGYVGLVRLEDGRVDVAAALVSGGGSAAAGTPLHRIESILRRSRFAGLTIRDASPLMTTPPLRRSRPAGMNRLLVIGDAAGYVEPFTGEGMTWAAQSAIAAADFLASRAGVPSQGGRAPTHDWRRVGQDWDRQSRTLLRRKKQTCRTVTSALRSSMARRVAGLLLSHWPGLAKPLIHELNR
ncbi:MAG: NAD(P)/FAD-dependent oxidoreductase [Planctomycetaceae bacterium]|nr:NAD(P)/FAD-dependent oxidoreductase [Planctomycetaceae bacterium]